MKLNVYTVFDSATGAYLPPFYLRSDGEAARMMMDSVKDPTHLFNRYPDDYRLYRLGSWDDATARWELEDAPVFLFTAAESLSQLLHRHGSVTELRPVRRGPAASLAEGDPEAS